MSLAAGPLGIWGFFGPPPGVVMMDGMWSRVMICECSPNPGPFLFLRPTEGSVGSPSASVLTARA